MKKCLATVLAAVLLLTALSFSAFADEDRYSGDSVTNTNVTEMADMIFEVGDQIVVLPSVLTENGADRPVYVVALMGAGYSLFKANNVISCFQSAFNKESKYLTLARNAVLTYVPEGGEIVFIGHSLGGMVEQQLICDPAITSAYTVTATLTFGSPYIMTDASLREGRLTRFADTSDAVPNLSPASILDKANQKNAIIIDGGYKLNPNTSHNLSYRNAAVWGEYDAMGVKGGTASITCSLTDFASVRA